MSPTEFASLLEAIIGVDVEHPELVIHALAFWFHHHPAANPADPVVMLAWRCIEARVPTGRVHDGYDTSEVAAGLVRLDPDRGFRLVDAAASRLVAGMRVPGLRHARCMVALRSSGSSPAVLGGIARD